MLFDAHWHAFRVFGGVPERGIYDNVKTAVDLHRFCSGQVLMLSGPLLEGYR